MEKIEFNFAIMQTGTETYYGLFKKENMSGCYYSASDVDARVAELEAELAEEKEWARRLLETREHAYKDLGRLQNMCKEALAEHDALKSDISDCKSDLAAYEAQRPDDDTFSLLAASYEQKISKFEAENERLRKALEAIREYLMGGIWIYSKSPDEFIKAALAAKEGGGDE